MNRINQLRFSLMTLFLLLLIPGLLYGANDKTSSTVTTESDTPVTLAAKPSPSNKGNERKPSQRVESKKQIPATPYMPPKGMGRPWPTQGGGTRGDTTCNPRLAVLAPHDHTGQTRFEQPNLYWYISETCQGTFVVTLLEEKTVAPLLEHPLEPPRHSGIQKVSLQSLKKHLEVGKRYQWSIAMVVDPTRRSKDIVAMGGITRVAATTEHESSDQKGKQNVTRTFLQAGLWYDAIDALSEEMREQPTQELVAQQATLLQQVHLDQIVKP